MGAPNFRESETTIAEGRDIVKTRYPVIVRYWQETES